MSANTMASPVERPTSTRFSSIRTKHQHTFAASGSERAARTYPEGLRLSLQADIAAACSLPIHCVTIISVAASTLSISVEYECTHPLSLKPAEIDTRVAGAPLLSLHYLIGHSSRATNLPGSTDSLIQSLCDALCIRSADGSSLTLPEVAEKCRFFAAARDDSETYESEISDLLRVVSSLSGEVQALQVELARANEELDRYVLLQAQSEASALRVASKAQVDIAQLRDVISKLQQLVAQGSDRPYARSHNQGQCDSDENVSEGNSVNADVHAKKSLLGLGQAHVSERLTESIYVVTLEEYNTMKERVDELLSGLADERAVHEETRQVALRRAEDARHSGERVDELTRVIDDMTKAAEEERVAHDTKMALLQQQCSVYESRQTQLLDKITLLDSALCASKESISVLRTKMRDAETEAAQWRADAASVCECVEGALHRSRQGRVNGEPQSSNAMASGGCASSSAFASTVLSAWHTLEMEVVAFRRRRLMAFDERLSQAAATVHLVDEVACRKDDVTATSNDSIDAVSPDTIFSEPLLAYTGSEVLRWRQLCDRIVRQLNAVRAKARIACEARGDAAERRGVFAELECLCDVLTSVQAEAAPDATPLHGLYHMLRIIFTDEAQSNVDPIHEMIHELCNSSGVSDSTHDGNSESKLLQLVDALRAARQSGSHLQADLDAAKEELDEMRACLDSCSASDGILHRVAEVIQGQGSGAVDSPPSSVIVDQAVALQSEVSALRMSNSVLNSSIATHESNITILRQRLDELGSIAQSLTESMMEQCAIHDETVRKLESYERERHDVSYANELLHLLTLRDQELFELSAARTGEKEEHQNQLGILQSHIERLRAQLEDHSSLRDGVQQELQRLRAEVRVLGDELTQKEGAIAELTVGMEEMTEAHEKQISELEIELESRSKDASDALARWEEMTAMLKEAREGEESALKLRMKSDAEVFRLQKLFDHVKPQSNEQMDTKHSEKTVVSRVPKTKKKSVSSRVRAN